MESGRVLLIGNDSPQKKLAFISYLRGASVFLVVILHLGLMVLSSMPQFVHRALSFFSYATRIFFFASGFGLYLSYLRRRLTYGAFLRKRMMKIYLPYIAAVFICAAVPFIYPYNDKPAALLSHVFLYMMFIEKYIQAFGPYWFMAAIFQYYLLFFLFVKMKQTLRSDRLFLLIWVIISLCYFGISLIFPSFVERDEFVYKACFPMHAWIFTLGMAAAERYHREGSLSISRKQLILTFLLSAIAFVLIWATDASYMYDIPVTIMLLCLLTAIWPLCERWNGLNRILLWFDTISFEWYLLHLLVFECIIRALRPAGLAQQLPAAVLAFILSLLVAVGYSKGVSWCRRRLSRQN